MCSFIPKSRNLRDAFLSSLKDLILWFSKFTSTYFLQQLPKCKFYRSSNSMSPRNSKSFSSIFIPSKQAICYLGQYFGQTLGAKPSVNPKYQLATSFDQFVMRGLYLYLVTVDECEPFCLATFVFMDWVHYKIYMRQMKILVNYPLLFGLWFEFMFFECEQSASP